MPVRTNSLRKLIDGTTGQSGPKVSSCCNNVSVATEGIDPVRQKGLDLCIRPTRAVVMSNAVLLAGIVRNLVRNAIKYAGGCFRKLWRRPRPA